jgi:hypothetical protein
LHNAAAHTDTYALSDADGNGDHGFYPVCYADFDSCRLHRLCLGDFQLHRLHQHNLLFPRPHCLGAGANTNGDHGFYVVSYANLDSCQLHRL